MKKLSVFNHISIDGYYAGPGGEIDWFQSVHEEEWNRYAARRFDLSGNSLMFGRKTYSMMHGWWPSPAAREMDPRMAEVMSTSPKIVFSTRLKRCSEEPNWKNIRLLHGIDREEIRSIKRKESITILGSGTIVQQLMAIGLVDEFTLIVVPVILGRGKPLFKGIERASLRLVEEKRFRNGVILLRYCI
jgi:dihydrofolate reductase